MAKQTKAAFYTEFGGVDKIQVGNLDLPEVKEGEVLLRVKAAGVNPVDSLIREGYLQQMLPAEFPVVPGWDMAGVVEERGHGARRFAVGTGVYGYIRRPTVQHGTFAEYMVVPESYLALRPGSLSWEQAAGIPLAGLTAYQSLFDAGQLQAGQTVLILGASGGVGGFAIQLAKDRGTTVVAVASEPNFAYMKELGADFTVDYRNGSVGDAVKALVPAGVDLIFDCISGDTLTQSLPALKPGGTLVSILHNGQGLDASINFHYVFVEPNTQQLDELRQLADAGKLTVKIAETYPLAEVQEALKQIESHHTTGKIVVVP
ncbi:NADP-dependent oxidoreductase [Hymenobacter siberiensis]|jgi:NADPH:quinone reductase-like Zn-dependent oxidoreductase|uniref:NADP-dependent oxidoreductase n=1 Tax=Hymenobacter siberiensis TaxID=2848396 RepID=UPI001C1DE416|nr:NADP-dependent oxidoreductase [Hymenobacter siberiensis]MBU6120250.1 NADP-dependent oxidoreductase [Hymenobacter siberiensis]